MANAVLNLSDLNGSNGFVINGIDAGNDSGFSVSSAGDINGDGFDDLIIGAPFADPNGQNGSGSSYVVFGSSSGFAASLNLSTLNGSNGFVINGIDAGDGSGFSVSSVGDINGDGFDDLIIGASYASPNGQRGAGESYVVFGSKAAVTASLDLSSLNGSNGFVINGIDGGDGSGFSVSSAGDINDDGIDDLIIGAPFAQPNGQPGAGESYVVFGSNSGFTASLDLSSLDGSNGFVINGIDWLNKSGISVSSAGDINGDGIDDLIIGASYTSLYNETRAGQSYVVFGSSSGFVASLNLSSLNGSNGFAINGIDGDDRSGSSVSSAGDINGDGFDDLIIGAPGASSFTGECYVVFGSNSGFAASFDLSSLNGNNGFMIKGNDIDEYVNLGRSVSTAGDINSDGFDDLIIGGYGGESYVVFGRSSSFSDNFDLSSLDGSEGFVINDTSGISVSSAGDINGDGFDDLIIGAPFADPNGQERSGSSYVVFGFASPKPTNKPPVAVNDTVATNEDTAVNIEVLANDSNSLTVTAVNGEAVVAGTAITLNSGALVTLNANGSLTYDPNAQFDVLAVGENGIDNFTYTISNGSLIDTASVNLTINGVNDAPKVTSVFNLSSLNGSNGFVINGITPGDRSGYSVSSVGDINGDGINDLMIGAPFAERNSQFSSGESYIVFGSSSSFTASLDLSSLNGSNGFVINGIDENDRAGRSVSSAGDINGDGIHDLIIGAPGSFADRSFEGESYVVFGSSGFGASLNLSSLDGSNGFVINGIDAGDNLGYSVSNAGDINGDGIHDLIIGASNAAPNGQENAGKSYVVFGSSGFGASLNLSSLDGSNGFVINGIDAGDNLGYSVSNAGDINGDGIHDLIIGASNADPNGQENAGKSYVVFSSSSFTASLDLSTLNGSNGFMINGIDKYDNSGRSVSSAGDINGDGIDDLIIGAPGLGYSLNRARESYVVFGRSSGFATSLDLSSLDGSNGFVINGIDAGDDLGSSVSNAGDINGDGIDDLIIGAPGADPNGKESAGESYVVFGRSSGFAASLDLSSLYGSNGFVINGIDARDYSGRSVSSAGDINGDGIDDLIIGASYADPKGQERVEESYQRRDAGESYVVFGFATAATTNEDTAVNILASNILRRYTDAEGDRLTIDDFTNPTNGTLTLNDNTTPDNPSDDFFTYTPNANFNGTDSFNFTVSDGNGGSISSTFNLNVKPVNDAPVAANDRFTTGFNTAVSIQASTLLANDTDIDSSSLSITGVSGATKGIAVLNDNGTQGNSADDFIVFTPTNGFSGNAKFNYTISDGSLTSTASAAIAVGANITGTNGNDTISGTPGDDKICGGNGNDTICGGKGNDTISGGNGKDTIYGGKGNDILTGGNGNDTIYGGKGKDILTGGNGKDKFIFASKEGTDTITGFRKGTDLIGLSGGLTFGQLSFCGNNILVSSTQEILTKLTGINTNTLIASDFIIVSSI